MDVGGGAVQGTPQLGAVFHMAAKGVFVAEQLLCIGQIACGQSTAHGGAGCPLVGHQHRRRALGDEFGLLLQQGKIAAALCTKTEVVTHQQIAGV